MDNSTIQTIYLRNNGNLGTAPTKQIADIYDLNNYIIKKLNENPTEIPAIFYFKYRFIRLRDGIFERCTKNSTITYKKIRDLSDVDYQILAQERQDAITYAIQRHQNRRDRLQEVACND